MAYPADEPNGGVAAVVRWLVLLSIPLSLVSPGTTIALALVAIYGIVLRARGHAFPADIASAGRYTIILYAIVLTADLLNGGGLANFWSTGFNYLHLLAIAPLAFAMRETGLNSRDCDRAMQITVAIALTAAVAQFMIFNMARPGGLLLNPIPYGFVLALWGVFLLSRGLEQGRSGFVSIAAAMAAFVPVLLTESKIAWACMLVGYAGVTIAWAHANRRWGTVGAAMVVAVPLLYLAVHFFAYRRIEPLAAELELFFQQGLWRADSFGWRYELAISGLRAFWESPVFGYGLNERMAAVFAHDSVNGPDITELGHIHNDYVTHIVAFGIAGLGFLGAFLYFMARVALRCVDSAWRRAGLALTVMVALYMLFEVAFNMDPISGAMTIAIALLFLPAAGAGVRSARGARPEPAMGETA